MVKQMKYGINQSNLEYLYSSKGQATIFMGFVQRDDNYTTLGALLAGQTKLSVLVLANE